jgi:hypothetical protein
VRDNRCCYAYVTRRIEQESQERLPLFCPACGVGVCKDKSASNLPQLYYFSVVT